MISSEETESFLIDAESMASVSVRVPLTSNVAPSSIFILLPDLTAKVELPSS